MIFAIAQAHAAGTTAKVGMVKTGVWESVLQASLPVQLLLVLLITLSIVSWGIILLKYFQYKKLDDANFAFAERFWKASSLEAIYEKISEFPDSNLARVFKNAYLELQRIADSGLGKASAVGEAAPRLGGLDNLERSLRKSVDTEISFVESRLSFLATTGSTSPFIGLLGTVLGIMTSFAHIANTGSASLAVVAPGISEALFSTAVGLFAAIPAVVSYNYFIGRVRKLEIDFNNFSNDFLNIAKRNFFKE
jgi:biopolymer transport protein TolQ